jgi:hypothetical protein
MDRRGFLSLGRRGRLRMLDLSCERLYLRWVDAQGRMIGRADEDATLEGGEPPMRIAAETPEELLGELARRLDDADIVRIRDARWLSDEGLRGRVEAILHAFERRGGRVERGRSATPAGSLAFALLLSVLGAAPAAAQATSDDALRTRVEAALAQASDLPADSISVQVQGGVVTLSGSVVCESCGGAATPGGTGTVQQSLGAVVRAIPGVTSLRFALSYGPPVAR